MNPMVSVIVPVFEKRWLSESLASIKANTKLELIIVSDPKGLGAAQARNKGLKRAGGEYVMFVDSDDYLEPEAIDLMLKEIEHVDMVCGSFRKFGEFDSKVTHPTQTMGLLEVASYVLSSMKHPGTHQMLSACWAKLYKRELIRDFPELVTAEDMAFNFDYLKRCHRVKFLENVVYHNRKRNDSLSTSLDLSKKERLFGLLDGFKQVRDFLEFCGVGEDEIEDALDSSKVYHSMLYFTRIHGSGRETFKRIYP